VGIKFKLDDVDRPLLNENKQTLILILIKH